MNKPTWQDEIKAWRKIVAPWHPTPPPLENAAYLATEAGEVLDAVLRLQRPHDDRTNGHDRKKPLGREIAQVIDMALTLANQYGINVDDELFSWCMEVEARGAKKEAAG